MKKLIRFTFLSLALASLLIPLGMFAQTTSTTGAITGIVTDTQNNVLPGVTVTATSPNLQGARTAVTGANGEYILSLLPPGTYRVQYELQGIKAQNREGVVVNANQQTKVNIPMTMAVTETMTVTASSVVVDPTQTTQQMTLKEDTLKYSAVGSGNRSYQNAVANAPDVGSSAGGNPIVAGANLNSNNFMLDGVNALTDPVTHTFSANLGFDAIQEISVLTFGKDAEYRSSGATVNVVTKSGGNKFSGSFDYRYNDPNFLQAGKQYYPAPSTYYGGPPNGAPSLKFNKKAQTAKSIQPTATLGGPILQDKLWFFVNLQKPHTARQAANTIGIQPGPREFTGWNNIGKITFTPFANQTVTGRYYDSHAKITNTSFSSLVPPEADALQSQSTKNYGLSYDSIISSHWLGNLQLSHTPSALTSGPMSGDLHTPGVTDRSTGISSVNFTNFQSRTSYRNELLGSTTYYLEAMGTHALKFGASYDKNGFTSVNYRPGDLNLVPGLPADACFQATGVQGLNCGVSLQTNNGAPNRALVGVINPPKSVTAKQESFYAQDQWSPITPLTVRAGLRYDHVAWGTNRSIPAFKLLQPRIGLAYDIFNNASSVIHAYGGKIIDENQLTLPSNAYVAWSGTAIFNYNATTKQYVFTRTGTTLSQGGVPVDPNLKSTYSNEYSLGYTQKLPRNTSLDITGEVRKAHNMFGLVCGNTTTQVPCFFTNAPPDDPGFFRTDYRGVTTKLETRPTSNSDLIVSWIRSKSRGSVGVDNASGQNVSGAGNFFPINFTNYYGFQADDAKNRIKFQGYYQFPWQITLGANYYWDSGTPWNVTQSTAFGTALLEPRGSRRFPAYSQLDAQLQKDFNLFGAKFGLIGSVLNVMNKEIATGVNGNAGTLAKTDPTTGKLYIDPNQQTGPNRLSATFGRFTSFQQPRRYEVGFRFEF